MDESRWSAAFGDFGPQMIQRLAAYLPNVLAAVALLALGYVLAALSRAFIRRIVAVVVEKLTRRKAVAHILENTGLHQRIPRLTGGTVYWVILLFFVAAATERLELSILTTLAGSVAAFLPRLLLGVLIVLAGFLAGNLAHAAVMATTSSTGLRNARLLARSAQGMILFMGVIIGAEQIGIESTMLTVLVTTVVGIALGGAAVATREEVVEILDQYKLTTLPVVDIEGRLLGVIRYDALVRAVEQEASADIQSMVGVSPEERSFSNVLFSVRKRLPWLQINLVTAFLAAAVVGIFEDTIARFTALAVLLPVVAGQSGNTGAQALAVTMRGLTLREVRLRHWPRLAFKEASVGMINGLAVAAVTSLGVYVWSGSMGLSLVIGMSMVISMVLAGIAGIAVPMVLSATGQDPAQSASIILTTVTDITGFFSFLGLATIFSSLL